jgi:5-methylcytosine-specific restriction endonuclease McrA
MAAYAEKLKDPRWQKKRLEIFERDGWKCVACKSTDNSLNVHHLQYRKGKDPWDYSGFELATLCEPCHKANLLIDKYIPLKAKG